MSKTTSPPPPDKGRYAVLGGRTLSDGTEQTFRSPPRGDLSKADAEKTLARLERDQPTWTWWIIP